MTEKFGPVEQWTIAGGGLTARIVSAGAAIQDLRLEGHEPPLVLGFADPQAYRRNPTYFGAVVGRHANRIHDGRFALDGASIQLERNFLGKHNLHGGASGYSTRDWKLVELRSDAITLSLVDEAGIGGFPGRLEASLRYELLGEGALRMMVEATADRPTPCNLAQHSYFNLDDGGSSDCRRHSLRIDAEAYLPVDGEMIPTGRVEPVAETAFDFRALREIGESVDELYDHNFCTSAATVPLRCVAEARGARSGVLLEVWSTEPGLQFYSGQYLEGVEGGLEGRVYREHAGFCLEAQAWPDSVNRPYFPQAILRPGETYRQHTEFRFKKG